MHFGGATRVSLAQLHGMAMNALCAHGADVDRVDLVVKALAGMTRSHHCGAVCGNRISFARAAIDQFVAVNATGLLIHLSQVASITGCLIF